MGCCADSQRRDQDGVAHQHRAGPQVQRAASKRRSTATPTDRSPPLRSIAELVKLAKEMRDDQKRHEELGLAADDRLGDAIAKRRRHAGMGDATLKRSPTNSFEAVRASATIDWNLKESVRATMRTKNPAPSPVRLPALTARDKAVELVLQQAELFAGAA